MIFVTVGTTPFPFRRMVQLVEEIICEQNDCEEIVFQYGTSNVSHITSKKIHLYPELSYEQMIHFIQSARAVVCHGGPATIFLCFSYRIKPFCLPRSDKFKEHVNNHQQIFVDYLINQHLVFPANDIFKKFTLRQNKYTYKYGKTLNNIINYLNNLYG